ncbi:hypothetical protein EIP86_009617 [Pleurotus ostreatoroseus]|nr:hypothetical protein EIP86_009617 [Pleurotus ostreatoroseus]
MTYIPRPVYGMITVSVKSNGHYGMEDPIQWPQFMEEHPRYAWLAAVSRKPEDTQDPRLVMWEALREADFQLVDQNSPKRFGIVGKTRLDRLRLLVNDATRRVENFEMENGRRDDSELHWLKTHMSDAFDRLDYPSTFRDMIRQHACVQRFWMLTHAWLEWHVHIWHNYKITDEDTSPRPPVRDDLMGAFTTSPIVAQRLLGGGIPVWFSRLVEMIVPDDVLESVVPFTDPSGFPLDDGNLFPPTKSYVGLAGKEHVAFIQRYSQTYEDSHRISYDFTSTSHDVTRSSGVQASLHGDTVSQSASQSRASAKGQSVRYTPYPAGEDTKSAKTKAAKSAKKGSQKKKTKLQPPKRDRFADFKHPCMPPMIPVWQEALASVDQTKLRSQAWGYWLPEPALIIGPSDPVRAARYLGNWLRIRESWCAALGEELSRSRTFEVKCFKNQEWRDYLNVSEKAIEEMLNEDVKRRGTKLIVEHFQELFAVPSILRMSVPTGWLSEDLSSVPEHRRTFLKQQMMWELAELGFYRELTEIDLYMITLQDSAHHDPGLRTALVAAIFPSDRTFPMWEFPASTKGLEAEDIWDRVPHLEALRQLMGDWPSVPPEIKSSGPLDSATPTSRIQDIEKRMANFYCEAFLEASGRPPILPRRLPRC